ncbi:nuclear transport factor 2 family protein [Christiangramia portivictoriae]|uniref:nuclear transport factor 2 family protein n=1 Tax=Christiangramia portivictoriae TaxID=326069 RepID=UPI000688485F|nr:nuclear transport factor 2 family protein [Christiangramia portivictoriae]
MSKTWTILCFCLFLLSCNEHQKEEKAIRYSQDSEQISIFKTVLQDYENADWDKYQSHFADSMELFYNSRQPIDLAAAVAMHKENNAVLSSYDFQDSESEFEMVVTDAGETWVNFWGAWEGTIAENDSVIVIPVHITARFENGKIVKEYLYFNNAGISDALRLLNESRNLKDSIN